MIDFKNEILPWLALLGYGMAIFLFGLYWTAHERAKERKRKQSSTSD